MKIVISRSTTSDSTKSLVLANGAKYLKRLGHNILDTNIDTKDIEKAFLKNDKYIKDCDILILDLDYADSKVGYEIARALDEKKVVIAFQKEGSKITDPLIHANPNKNLVIQKFTDKNIESSIEDALKSAASRLDSKFILIISSEMDRYLNWASKTKRTHKAQVVRAAVEQMMKKDKEYRDYNGE